MTKTLTLPDGTRLAYDVQGSGKPLLCLAGLTRNRSDFDYVLPHLSGVQVIRLDYRGRGASDWTGPATYTVLQEAQDVLALLDHLGLAQTAILGTSRGGLIGMLLAAMAGPRLTGLCLNDIGPAIDPAGLQRIAAYVGRRPAARDLGSFATALAEGQPAFQNVPPERWLQEATHHARVTPDGLDLTYDPALREAFQAGMTAPAPDLWPLFDACASLPVTLIRGANTDLLSMVTVAEMQFLRPDMGFANVPDRGHVPFLDEPASLTALHAFIGSLP